MSKIGDMFSTFGGPILDTLKWNIDRNRAQSNLENSISMRVADAKRAGIHPLAALGVNPASGPSIKIGDTFTRMGQNFSNTRKQEEKLIGAQIATENAKAKLFNAQARAIDPNNNNPVSDNITGPNPVSLPPGQNSPKLEFTIPRVSTSASIGQETGVHPLKQSHIDNQYRLWDLESQQAQESISEGSFFTQIRYNLTQASDYVRGYGAYVNLAPQTLQYLKKQQRQAAPGYEYRYNVIFGGFILRRKVDGKSYLFDHPKLNKAVHRSINLLHRRGMNTNRSPVPKGEYKLWNY